MRHVAAQCNRCGASLTPEEIEIGSSLDCPRCRKKPTKQQPPPGKPAAGPKQGKRNA